MMGRRHRVYGWLREHPVANDTIFIVVPLLFFSLTSMPIALAQPLPVWMLALFTLLTAGMVVPLAWRRTRPVTSAAFVAGFSLIYLAGGFLPTTVVVAVPISVYALTTYAPRWAGRAGLSLAVVGGALFGLRSAQDAVDPIAFTVLATMIATICISIVLVAWLLGDLARVRRLRLEDLAERNHRLVIEREQETQLAASAERARIAREMHDVVAHSLSIMIAQADGGRYAAASDPEAAVSSLDTIAVTGRSALTEMRRLLGVLRSDADADTRPQPTLADVPDLADAVTASGLTTTFESVGPARGLSTGAELAAYRIVQEALTNSMKHGGPRSQARVVVEYAAAGIHLRIGDTGRGAGADPSDGQGQGIRGMMERAALYGGRVTAGPAPGGGFAVQAFFPYDRER